MRVQLVGYDAADVAAAKSSLSELCSDGRALYWLESRPLEAGRVVLVRLTEHGGASDHSPPGVSIRSRVHEYGGAAVVVQAGSPTWRTSGCIGTTWAALQNL